MTKSLVAAITLTAWLCGSNAEAQTSSKCIALTLPSLRGTDGNSAELSASLRAVIASFLTAPSVRILWLEARLPESALEEARQNDCGRVLTTSFTRKRSNGGMGGVLGQAAGAAAWQLPYGATASANAVRSATIAGAAAVSTIASNTRAKDEVRLEYRVLETNGSTLRDGNEKEKARADGEDLVTPLVERMATVVAALVAK